MPNHKDHQQIAVAAAVVVEGFRGIDEPAALKLAALLGAAVGGAIGGALPDVLEPAIHPHHRDYCHGAAGTLWLATNGLAATIGLSEFLRKQSESQRCERLARSTDPLNEPSFTLIEIVNRIVAALLVGIVVGYVSHVAADACSKRGVPVFTRHFI